MARISWNSIWSSEASRLLGNQTQGLSTWTFKTVSTQMACLLCKDWASHSVKLNYLGHSGKEVYKSCAGGRVLTRCMQLSDKEESTTSSCNVFGEGKPAMILQCFSFQSLTRLGSSVFQRSPNLTTH